jgi:hypothetical protein
LIAEKLVDTGNSMSQIKAVTYCNIGHCYRQLEYLILDFRDYSSARRYLTQVTFYESTRDSAFSGLGIIEYMEKNLLKAIDMLHQVDTKSSSFSLCQSLLVKIMEEHSGNVTFNIDKSFWDEAVVDELLDAKFSQETEEDEEEEDELVRPGPTLYRRSVASTDYADTPEMGSVRRRIDFQRESTPPPRTVQRRTLSLSSSPVPGDATFDDGCEDMELDTSF